MATGVSFTNYLANALINHVLRNTAYTSPGTSVYMALFTAAPGDAGGGTEVAGGSYARVQIDGDIAAPSNGLAKNGNAISFPTATADWGTVTHWAIFDASTAGNMLFYGALTTPIAILNGNTRSFDVNDFSILLD